jgi:putative methionine-R-sulfoxide reductase with GAF domain
MTSPSEHARALEEIERAIDGGRDADDVLRDVVALLHERFDWVGVYFVEGADLVLGPSAGARPAGDELSVPIVYDGRVIGELHVGAGDAERVFLERVALLVAPFCLVGWDTGGERWSP